MPILENPRHERFAQLRASGKTGSDSYRAIAGKDARYADVRADQLMKMPGVRERIEELKTEASAKCSLSREAYIKSLVEMYEAKPSEASMDNPRCDVVVVRGQKQAVFPPKVAGRPATGQAGQLGRLDQGRAGGRRESGRLSGETFRGWRHPR